MLSAPAAQSAVLPLPTVYPLTLLVLLVVLPIRPDILRFRNRNQRPRLH